MKTSRRIAVITSGGDASGMNAAIRAMKIITQRFEDVFENKKEIKPRLCNLVNILSN